MPELRCPECGNELLPPRQGSNTQACTCTKCGREVYAWSKDKVKVSCPKCGKTNEATVVR